MTVMPWPPPSVRAGPARTLGERVRAQRLRLGLSQERLGERAGMSGRNIGDIERGVRNVTLYNLVRIAKALEVDPGLLVTGIEP